MSREFPFQLSSNPHRPEGCVEDRLTAETRSDGQITGSRSDGAGSIGAVTSLLSGASWAVRRRARSPLHPLCQPATETPPPCHPHPRERDSTQEVRWPSGNPLIRARARERSLVRRQTRDSTTLTAVALTPCAALQPDRPMRLAGPMFRTREPANPRTASCYDHKSTRRSEWRHRWL